VDTDPTGVNPPITFRHNGYNNSVAIANFLHTRFPSINKLLVTGFSAGVTLATSTGQVTNAVFGFTRNTPSSMTARIFASALFWI
jgi:hypothetical protein